MDCMVDVDKMDFPAVLQALCWVVVEIQQTNRATFLHSACGFVVVRVECSVIIASNAITS
eukprot:m.197006 g.197006  ORF g.197006 m.197006 type:complete len:60 (+) comp39537_c0_seq8:758-937(+)